MGASLARTDYEWSYTQEPHATRRKEIMKKYPQVKKLMTPDPFIAVTVICLVAAQIGLAYLMQDASWTTILIMAYCVGGTINHSMTLAIHEISHNIPFGNTKLLWNRILGIVGNFPIGLPMSISFKKYHIDHHRYQGDEIYDTDIPAPIEAWFFNSRIGKFFWLLLQPVFYSFRPFFIHPKAILGLEVVNVVAQIAFDATIVYFFSWKSLIYLIIGTPLAMGLHPVAGHFVSEHYMFYKGYETYSYYGPLNMITFNVGYHNEHHDFPSIPGSRLPELRKMAPEYYENLPCHTSWVKVLWDFMTDPAIGPYSRVRRSTKIYKHE